MVCFRIFHPPFFLLFQHTHQDPQPGSTSASTEWRHQGHEDGADLLSLCPFALQPGTCPQRGVLNHPQWIFLPLFAQPHSEAKTCHVSSSERKTQASVRTRTYKTLFTTYIHPKPDFILCFLRAARSVCQGTPFRKGGDYFFSLKPGSCSVCSGSVQTTFPSKLLVRRPAEVGRAAL